MKDPLLSAQVVLQFAILVLLICRVYDKAPTLSAKYRISVLFFTVVVLLIVLVVVSIPVIGGLL